MDLPVPMAFRIAIKRAKDDGKNNMIVFADEVHNIFILEHWAYNSVKL